MKKYMFTAKWCSNCQVMKPIVSKIEGVEIIDAELHPDIAAHYGVMGLPTFITDGEEIKFKTGIFPAKVIEEFYGN